MNFKNFFTVENFKKAAYISFYAAVIFVIVCTAVNLVF